MQAFTPGQRLIQALGKLRRWYVALMRPEMVSEGIRRRRGSCRKCGTCCRLVYTCPLLVDGRCKIYSKRPKQCAEFPVFERDLVGIEDVCGYSFVPAESRVRHPNRICRFLGVARYGVREVALSMGFFGVIGGLLLLWSPRLAALPALGILGVLYFFRDPERRIPEGEEKILSPADGRVKDIVAVTEDKFLGGEAVRIGITLSLFNVHVNRAPCSGEVEYIKYKRGSFHNAFGSKASDENESNMIGIRNGPGDGGVAVKQIAGAIARRIVCDCRLDEHVERGQRIGMIKFGSRTEIYIPVAADFELLVKPGDRVKGGQTVLGIVRCEE